MPILLYLLPALALAALLWAQIRGLSFSLRVFSALVLALLLGTLVNILQARSTLAASVLPQWLAWLNLVGGGYVDLLRMVSIPLIMISILSALVNIDHQEERVLRTVGIIIATLLVTVVLAALISIGVSALLRLSSASLLPDTGTLDRWEQLQDRVQSVAGLLRSLLPSNPFLDMTAARSSSIAAVVIFSLFVAWGYFSLGKDPKNHEAMSTFRRGVNALQKVIISMVRNVLRLTPYGIFAILLRVAASTDFAALQTLARFLVATYAALALVLLLHLIILTLLGYSPFIYLRKAWPALSLAFSSRSSAGTLPLTIETQEKAFGLRGNIASVAGSLGTTVGQNGCAGVYPAMLVVMIWNATGHSIHLVDVLSLLGVILISSLGVAGVGGGATFASIMVLTTMGLGEHLALAVVLTSIEPVIDMGRTLVNVSGSMVSGLVTGRFLGGVDQGIYNSPKGDIDQAAPPAP